MGFFDTIKGWFGGSKKGADDEAVGEQLAKDSTVRQVIISETEQRDVPAKSDVGEEIPNEEMDKPKEESVSESESESESESDVTVKAYNPEDDAKEDAEEGETSDKTSDEAEDVDIVDVTGGPQSEETSDETTDESSDEDDDVEVVDVTGGPQSQEQTDKTSDQLKPAPEKEEVKKQTKQEKRAGMIADAKTKMNPDEISKLDSVMDLQRKSGEEPEDRYKSSKLDNFQKAMDVGSLGASGLSTFAPEGSALSNGAGIAGESMSLVSNSIAIGKTVSDIKSNNKYTQKSKKYSQGFDLASSSLGAASNITNIVSGGHDFAKNKNEGAINAAGGVGAALGAASSGAAMISSSIQHKSAVNDIETIKKASEGGSDEFNKYANLALKANEARKTGAGINVAKNTIGTVGNTMSAIGKFSKAGGGDGIKVNLFGLNVGLDTIGSAISGVGAGLGFVLDKFVKSKKINKLKEETADSFIGTEEIKSKINASGKPDVNLKQTRKAIKTVLGYDTTDQMVTAIQNRYALTIREKAKDKANPEQAKYRMLIQGLGFNLPEINPDDASNDDLPSVSEIANRLSACDA